MENIRTDTKRHSDSIINAINQEYQRLINEKSSLENAIIILALEKEKIDKQIKRLANVS